MNIKVITGRSPQEVCEEANEFLQNNSAYNPVTVTTTVELAGKKKAKKKAAKKTAKKTAAKSTEPEPETDGEEVHEVHYHLVLKENSDGTRGPSEIYLDEVHPSLLAEEVATLPTNPVSVQMIASPDGILILAAWA